jgi:sulfur relay (sulfurtransferase) DsrC/TusE family protein
MNEQGELFYDYNHLPAGRMLLHEMQKELSEGNINFEWEFENDPEDLEEEE